MALSCRGRAPPEQADRHAQTVLRYIHANPFVAGLAPGLRYRYANYASYAEARTDGLTDWHPAYLSLAACARACADFCSRYRPTEKPASSPRWGAWRLWTTYGKSARAQIDLFGGAPRGAAPSRCQVRRG